MLLYLKAKLDELRVDYYTFARLAHIYLYGVDSDMTQCHINFIQHGIIAPHVVKYLKHLQEQENVH